MVCLGLALIGGLVWYLDVKLVEEEEARANQAVAGKVRQAQALVEGRDWESAKQLLRDALATENATELDEARSLLHQAEQGEADAVLQETEAALARKDVAKARKRLKDYLAQPHAANLARIRILLSDINLATSDARGLALLRRLSEPALAAFAQTGRLGDIDLVSNNYLRSVYRQTLRRSLPRAEAERTEARRRQEKERLARLEAESKRLAEEQARREARLRATPVYREVCEFIARARNRDRERRKLLDGCDKKLLEASAFLLVGNQDQGKAQDLRQDLERVKREQANEQRRFARWKDDLEDGISRIRANVKERIRNYKGIEAADWQVFDHIVDAELDGLWKDIQKGDEDHLEF
jgi:hypothetical protein